MALHAPPGKRYFLRYQEGGQEQVREFPSKAEAFKWFNWDCPAGVAVLEEVLPDGRRGVPKTLRRKDET